MPTLKSADKRNRMSQKARARNIQVRTRVHNARQALFAARDGKDRVALEEAYRAYCSVLDRAAKQGVIRKNTAHRRKTRAAAWLRKA